MAKKKLTTFSNLASTKKNEDNNNVNVNDNVDVKSTNDDVQNSFDENVDINKNINVNNNNEDFYGSLKSLAGKSTTKGNDKIKPTGIYFEKNVLKALKKLASNGGRGAQSKIVNDATKEAFIQAGILDKEGNLLI
ncbi:hypothetical protein FHE72_23430 (plasmid) [Rossellomorea vietnamensis]|uniref:Uncharacterized protein n=1 Tax=Rossellomorea vietnamensis TaxID=218284 RepID=A0A6I6UXJ7_9BACI|nr:hypothetical protein [Rossellomorea vietnamensis]QHE63946.1 hypothetical protein FHE72_23430 [Rossellomorea vietnamensis]